MKITIVTLFPQIFPPVFNTSIIKRAQEKNLVSITYIDIRTFGIGRHNIVDDKPYGGGVGMVLRVDVLDKAIQHARCDKRCSEYVILLDPAGKPFNQTVAAKLTSIDHIILVCGHYEGVDERVRDIVDMEISIGDYILTGGEIPAMVLVDAIIRLVPNVLEKEDATRFESFSSDKKMLEYPQYTRPRTYKNNTVPLTLLRGNHKEIAEWKENEALKRTQKKRPELLTHSAEPETMGDS